MEKQDLEVFDDVDFNNEAPRKRPAFITVLAILSWVYVAIGLLSEHWLIQFHQKRKKWSKLSKRLRFKR